MKQVNAVTIKQATMNGWDWTGFSCLPAEFGKFRRSTRVVWEIPCKI